MSIDLSKNDDLQRLFLLELLVDNVKFDYEKIGLPDSMLDLLMQTCVRFKFLDFPMIQVCEEDFCETQDIYNRVSDVVFKNGKSCFFSLSCLPQNTECLKLGAIILRHKDEPPPIVMGTCCVILDKGFVDVLNGVTETDEASKILSDIFPILDERGIIIGSLTLLVRLSCFGKAVITHFKVPQENDAGYIFANTMDQGRHLNPTQIKTPISHGYPDPCKEVRPDCNDTFPGAPSGTSPNSVPGMYPGNTPAPDANTWDTNGITPQNAQDTFPWAPPGTFPNTASGIYPGNKPASDVNMWGNSGLTPEASSATLAWNAPNVYPGDGPGTFPGATTETAPDTIPNPAPGMYPGGVPRPNVTPWETTGITPQDVTGNFPGKNKESASAVDLSKNDDLQRLFLLEILVDNVKFIYDKVDLSESTLDLLQQTCVRFKFLDFPVIEVCEEDFCQTEGIYNRASKIVFKNGKSYFFSLSCLPLNTKCLNLGAFILRHKDEPPPIIMGTSCIILDKGFVDVLNHFTETCEASKSLKDIFPIFDERGIIIGSLTVFVRLSCFGKSIITHFKVREENEAGYMFANTKDQERKVIPSATDIKTPLSHGYPYSNNPKLGDSNNIFYNAASPGTPIPEVVVGINPMDVSSNDPGNTPKISPMIYRGFPNPAPGDQSTIPGGPPGTRPDNVPGMYRENL